MSRRTKITHRCRRCGNNTFFKDLCASCKKRKRRRRVSFSTSWGIVSFMTDKPVPKLSDKKKEKVGQLAFADKVIDMVLKKLEKDKRVLFVPSSLATKLLAEYMKDAIEYAILTKELTPTEIEKMAQARANAAIKAMEKR